MAMELSPPFTASKPVARMRMSRVCRPDMVVRRPEGVRESIGSEGRSMSVTLGWLKIS
jgi:hypothetical protein